MKSVVLKYWHKAHPWVLTVQSPAVLKCRQCGAACSAYGIARVTRSVGFLGTLLS